MAKLVTMFMILIVLQAAMLMYTGSTAKGTNLWEFVTNTDNWTSTSFILGFIGLAGAIALAGVAAGTLFGFKSDFIIFAGAIAGFISMGAVLTQLSNIIRNDLISYVFTGCIDNSSSCVPVDFIIAIVVGTFTLYYVWTIIDWWRGRDY